MEKIASKTQKLIYNQKTPNWIIKSRPEQNGKTQNRHKFNWPRIITWKKNHAKAKLKKKLAYPVINGRLSRAYP